MTIPSAGTFEPGITFKTSPGCIKEASISFSPAYFPSLSFRSKRAVAGASSTSFLIASEVFPLASTSRYFPNSTNVIIIALVSKYIGG
uniref:Heavy metal ATPase n=1 Tax=Arundo donax TaxID=35708 RepID=A0A0A9G8B5_ARUDO